jgi:hypothetical protein
MALEVNLDAYQERAFRECVPGVTATYPWGRGSGKTFFGRMLIHAKAMERPGIQIGLLMPTLKQARKVFWPGLFEDYEGPLRHCIVGRANKTELEVKYRNGSRLTTWGAENAGGIRGQRFGMLIEDETDDISPDVEQAVIRPTFSRSGKSAIWVKFGTPRKGRGGALYQSFSKALRGERGYVGFSIRSSESPQVDQEWLADVKADTPPDIYGREYDVNFDAAGGRVYGDVFVESFHVRAPPQNIQWSEMLIGCDHGYEHPGCLLLIGVIGSGRDAVAWVLDEVYARKQSEDWWVLRASNWTQPGWYPGAKFYGDPSQPARLAAYAAGANVRVQDVDNAVEDGIAVVSKMFVVRPRLDDDGNETEKFARLYIHPRCINLLTELGCTIPVYRENGEARKPLDGVGPYMRKKDKAHELRYTEDVVKINDDACDALRYPVFNRFSELFRVGHRGTKSLEQRSA